MESTERTSVAVAMHNE